MKSFDRINRRTHLYLGLVLVPWMLMFGASSFIISHQGWFRSPVDPPWESLFDRPYQRPVPDQGDLRAVARAILQDCDRNGAFKVERPKPAELRITQLRFWDHTRIKYLIPEQRLTAERQPFRWDQALVRMHFRTGYQQPSFGTFAWAAFVDLTCVALLLWVASGLIMWWRLTRLRVWGAVALGAGILSFLLLVWTL
jgi:hypothetical protein